MFETRVGVTLCQQCQGHILVSIFTTFIWQLNLAIWQTLPLGSNWQQMNDVQPLFDNFTSACIVN